MLCPLFCDADHENIAAYKHGSALGLQQQGILPNRHFHFFVVPAIGWSAWTLAATDREA
jgi:hypothetical protein